ncbi:hypothetical protein [Nitrosococcus oceani]|uniref:hypothetical protein n=1 Tax=Nitrosococcus oceani TaxID=1229 RepID=UPI0012DC0DFF|nr:hypothetical protein [Nitrosococcus oceani]
MPYTRATNVIESVFATVRLRSNKVKNCTSETTLPAMMFKFAFSAKKQWLKIRGFDLLKNVIQGVNFVDGVQQDEIQTDSVRYAS